MLSTCMGPPTLARRRLEFCKARHSQQCLYTFLALGLGGPAAALPTAVFPAPRLVVSSKVVRQNAKVASWALQQRLSSRNHAAAVRCRRPAAAASCRR